jgi:hypothetical protein
MMPDSTTRLLQILRTSLALIKYYEGHPASALIMRELKENMQHAIDALGAVEAEEKASLVGDVDFLSEMGIRDLSPEKKR